MLQQQTVDTTTWAISPHRANFNVAFVHVPSEHQTVVTDVIQSLTSAGEQDIVQVFRASLTNVHDVTIGIQGVTTGDNNFEDFESYADSAAVRAEWVPSDTTNTDVDLETTQVHGGSQAMRFECSANKSVGDTVTRTISSADWSGYDTVRFYLRMHRNDCAWNLHIGDGTNDKYYAFTAEEANTWELHDVFLADFVDSGGTTPDMTAITKVWLEMTNCPSSGFNYIDDITIVNSSGIGSATVSLYDFGTNDDPSTLPSPMTLDDGTTSIEFDVPDVFTYKSLHLHYGVHAAKTPMTVGNYYGIGIHYEGAASVNVFGDDTNNRYSSGECYTVSGSTMTSKGANEDIAFIVFGTSSVYLEKLTIRCDGSPDNSEYNIGIANAQTGVIVDYLVKDGSMLGVNEDAIVFDTLNFSSSDAIMLNWVDASGSTVTHVSLNMFITYDPVDTYG